MFIKSSSRSSCSVSSRTTRILCTCLLSLIASFYSVAKERSYRVFDHSNGLPVSSISGFAQDAKGFFWFGTAAGLFRFDGTEYRQWAKEKLAGWHYGVYAAPDGEVFVFDLTHTLYHILPDEDAEPVRGPDGTPFTNVHDVAFTVGSFWVARQDGLFYRDEQNQWHAIPREIPGKEKIWKLSAGFDDALWVATSHGIWKVTSDLSYQKVLTRNLDGYIGNVIAHPDGSFFYMEKYPEGGKIFQWRDGHVTERIALKDNLHDFVLRGETVWVSGDRHMVAFRPNRQPEVLEAGHDAPIGGEMIVDNEGSLWITNNKELFQLPEPETELWTARDGLPDLFAIALHETQEGIWLSTWSGLGHLERGADWHAYNDHLMHKGEMCSDGQGTLWLYDSHDFWQRWQRKFIKHPQPTSGSADGCHRAPDGSVWMSTSRGLWRIESGQAPVLVSHPPGDDPGKVFEDSKGILWITRDEDICHAPVAPLKAGQQVEWSCEERGRSPNPSRWPMAVCGQAPTGWASGATPTRVGNPYQLLCSWFPNPSKN
jgi:ligand-binding sensor domain-containing protein